MLKTCETIGWGYEALMHTSSILVQRRISQNQRVLESIEPLLIKERANAATNRFEIATYICCDSVCHSAHYLLVASSSGRTRKQRTRQVNKGEKTLCTGTYATVPTRTVRSYVGTDLHHDVLTLERRLYVHTYENLLVRVCLGVRSKS